MSLVEWVGSIEPAEGLGVLRAVAVAVTRIEDLESAETLLRVIAEEWGLDTGSERFGRWEPAEGELAALLEECGETATTAILGFPRVRESLGRIWRLCDQSGLTETMAAHGAEYVRIAALAPMVLVASEKQLQQLVRAAEEGRQWKKPEDVLGESNEYDLQTLIQLAAHRSEQENTEALGMTLVRLQALCGAEVN